jgi:Uma2 family endonuclease
VRTVVLGQLPAELQRVIARRRALGLDTFDEVWEGDYHMAPAASGRHGWLDQQLAVLLEPLLRDAGLTGSGPVNIGGRDNFRVPDRAVHREAPMALWFPTAAMVIEIESPDDETWQKLDFYAGHGVDEVVIVSPESRTVTWLALAEGRYRDVEASSVIASGPALLEAAIDWPPSRAEDAG